MSLATLVTLATLTQLTPYVWALPFLFSTPPPPVEPLEWVTAHTTGCYNGEHYTQFKCVNCLNITTFWRPDPNPPTDPTKKKRFYGFEPHRLAGHIKQEKENVVLIVTAREGYIPAQALEERITVAEAMKDKNCGTVRCGICRYVVRVYERVLEKKDADTAEGQAGVTHR